MDELANRLSARDRQDSDPAVHACHRQGRALDIERDGAHGFVGRADQPDKGSDEAGTVLGEDRLRRLAAECNRGGGGEEKEGDKGEKCPATHV